MIACFAMSIRTSPLDVMRPTYTPDVLAQKARDAIRQIGYPERPADEAYGFEWNDALMKHVTVDGQAGAAVADRAVAAPVAAGVLVPSKQRLADGHRISHGPPHARHRGARTIRRR